MSEAVKKVKKTMIALFINAGTSTEPSWVRIKKSTALEIGLNPETTDYDYIADENPTIELDRYKPSIAGMPLTMYKGEPDFNAIWTRFYDLKTGSDAKTEAMVVFMFDGDNTGGYKAWKTEATLAISSMNAVDGTITFDLPFGGEIEKGTAKLVEGVPTFTAAVAA